MVVHARHNPAPAGTEEVTVRPGCARACPSYGCAAGCTRAVADGCADPAGPRGSPGVAREMLQPGRRGTEREARDVLPGAPGGEGGASSRLARVRDVCAWTSSSFAWRARQKAWRTSLFAWREKHAGLAFQSFGVARQAKRLMPQSFCPRAVHRPRERCDGATATVSTARQPARTTCGRACGTTPATASAVASVAGPARLATAGMQTGRSAGHSSAVAPAPAGCKDPASRLACIVPHPRRRPPRVQPAGVRAALDTPTYRCTAATLARSGRF